jgi:hypothetical protein
MFHLGQVGSMSAISACSVMLHAIKVLPAISHVTPSSGRGK